MKPLLIVLVVVAAAAGVIYAANRHGESDTPDGPDPTLRRPEPQVDRPARPERPKLPRSSCELGLSNCVVASGTVIYVEAVDPDGDGDAHFVTSSEQGVTAPGLTVFDVRTDLRPEPLPDVGDLVGGAGPVFRGSYGQKQIQVTEFHVAR
jgi:hypothetical protein